MAELPYLSAVRKQVTGLLALLPILRPFFPTSGLPVSIVIRVKLVFGVVIIMFAGHMASAVYLLPDLPKLRAAALWSRRAWLDGGITPPVVRATAPCAREASAGVVRVGRARFFPGLVMRFSVAGGWVMHLFEQANEVCNEATRKAFQ